MNLPIINGKSLVILAAVLTLVLAGIVATVHAQDGPPMRPERPGIEDGADGFQPPDGEDGQTGFRRPPRRRPPQAGDMLGWTLNKNMAAETLAELAFVDVSVIEEELAAGADIRDLLLSYEISLEDFKAGMKYQGTELLDLAVGCGLITAEEADEIIYKLENPPERPEPPEGETGEGNRPPRPDGPPAEGETI
jgi:hypothetical protein